MEFKQGDKVRYELSWWGKARWIYNCDRGGCGHWEEGVVISVSDLDVVVEGNSGRSVWPLQGHAYYTEAQWGYAGYLEPLFADLELELPACVCGADAVYGKGCGTHSHWCTLAA